MAQFVDPSRQYFRGTTPQRSYPAGFTGLLDWVESPESHIFKINVLGFRKDEIKVQLKEGRILVIKAECKEENQGKLKNIVWHRAERGPYWKGDFWRQIELQEFVMDDMIQARMANGVLTVVIHKAIPTNLRNMRIFKSMVNCDQNV